MEAYTKPVATAEGLSDTPEQERHVPLGYDSIPPRTWLSLVNRTYLQSAMEDLPEYIAGDWYAAAEKVIPQSNIVRNRYGKMDYDFFYFPFERMRVAISKILTETDFASRIESGEYGVILGEDTSGRIPTLFLKELIKGIAGAGNNLPATNFYASHRINTTSNETQRSEYKRNMKAYLEGLKWKYLSGENKGKKILICTEAVNTGGSVKSIIEILREIGCTVDILTFGANKKYTPPSDVRFYSGGSDPDAFDRTIDKNYMMSGVWKKDWEIHATPVNKADKETKENLLNESNTKKMREDLKIETEEAMRFSRYMAKYVGANVAQAYLDYKAGKFELFKKP